MTNKMKPFDCEDYFGFSGAESTDNHEPHLAYIDFSNSNNPEENHYYVIMANDLNADEDEDAPTIEIGNPGEDEICFKKEFQTARQALDFANHLLLKVDGKTKSEIDAVLNYLN
jgi:hypothetical protein